MKNGTDFKSVPETFKHYFLKATRTLHKLREL